LEKPSETPTTTELKSEEEIGDVKLMRLKSLEKYGSPEASLIAND
jgi:hypothetical protein